MSRKKAKWIKTIGDLKKELEQMPDEKEFTILLEPGAKSAVIVIAVDEYEEGILFVTRSPKGDPMTEQEKIDRVQELLLEPFQGCKHSENVIKKRLLFRFKAILSSLIEFDTEKKGGEAEINVKLPPDLWGAVLEKIENEGF